jgi:hypothetical protein
LSGFFPKLFRIFKPEPNFVLMDNNQPIGIFDSGIGGTSIWKEIHNLLPNEKKYLADSKNYTDKKR